MAEKINHHDFIELNYTGRLADGTVFDTTEKTVAEQNNLPTQGVKFSTMTICVGERQVLSGLDHELQGKDIGTTYSVKLAPE